MRDVLTTLAEIAGAILIVTGIALVCVPGAVVTAGVLCLSGGILAGRS